MSGNEIPSDFLNAASAPFIADLYLKYLDDPKSVDASWVHFFKELRDQPEDLRADIDGFSWTNELVTHSTLQSNGQLNPTNILSKAGDHQPSKQSLVDTVRALMLIRAFRVRGHLQADLDPLKLQKIEQHPDLNPVSYGFTAGDWDRPIFIDGLLGYEAATLHQIMASLQGIYCSTIGFEYMHIQDPGIRSWIQSKAEQRLKSKGLRPDEQTKILNHLLAAEEFEHFLDKKYTGTKRFGLDGAESTIPALEEMIAECARLGVKEIVIGMAHRGRLNVLANVMGKPFQAIFSEFQGNSANPSDVQGSGDVKYHLGTSNDRVFDGHKVHLSLTANPSHLEAVDPVVVGKVRAKQWLYGDTACDQVVSLLIHGDAAFSGQGIVAETLALADLKGYCVGGTLHLITNNQIGFTTSPAYSRFSPYCSDVAKGVQAPILHVNGDDPEAVAFVARMASQFRQTFKKDIVIDLICYRRYGHNEIDEPSFTQPLMYKTIASLPSIAKKYAGKLIQEKILTQDEVDHLHRAFYEKLDSDFQHSKTYKPQKADWLEGQWSGLEMASGDERRGQTAIEKTMIQSMTKPLTAIPQDFHIHPMLIKQLKIKEAMLKGDQPVDWATAEALAFGSLLMEGYRVRLSGQDCGRGTFSQRHAVWVDQQNEARYVPLNHLQKRQSQFEVIDSPLSEAGVLGFEYGYSLADPKALVLWEGQFGDFVNGAQVIIDQFISSAESKWLRMSGLVMLLPHGFEGQGPEHSSGRVERFLQSCAEDNMQVVNCTTPANYFHVLRRQIHRSFRKPLIIMTPKSLLRHKMCVSNITDFVGDSTFHRLLYDLPDSYDEKRVRRVVLCSGKVYYDLVAERTRRKQRDVAIFRIEQLYPFPHKALTKELLKFPKADLVWCQEEPRNMGPWHFVRDDIAKSFEDAGQKHPQIHYAGRLPAAAPATGMASRHQREQEALIDQALTID